MKRWAVVDRPVCNEDGNFTGHWSCEEEDPNGPFVLWDDHLAAVEEARRAGMKEVAERVMKFNRLYRHARQELSHDDAVNIHEIAMHVAWLARCAEGRGE